jgi:Protein phosphatase 2C
MDEQTRQLKDQTVFGPLRIFPGRLSVSRAFGDIEAKRRKYGGNPLVLNANPDIKQFKIEDLYDFILLGCDGIFDKLSDT